MPDTQELLRLLAKERPLGTPKNNEILDLVEKELAASGCELSALGLDCLVWKRGRSYVRSGGLEFPVAASPFSPPFEGRAAFVPIRNPAELERADCRGKIILLMDEISREPLLPKEYPFYYPDAHRELIDILEKSGCAAILAVTARHPGCGLNPFPLFADGNFSIPSAYLDEQTWKRIERAAAGAGLIFLAIRSGSEPARSRQPIALKRSANPLAKVVICAHMDSQYDTPAALDNAAGVAVLLRLAGLVRDREFDFDLEFVPFNSEEYFGAVGELAYLERLERGGETVSLLINIDSPCRMGADIAVAAYNFGPEREKTLALFLEGRERICPGEPWYAGDHVPFAVRGVPCLTIASADPCGDGLKDTHTVRDTLDKVDVMQIENGAAFLADLMWCF